MVLYDLFYYQHYDLNQDANINYYMNYNILIIICLYLPLLHLKKMQMFLLILHIYLEIMADAV